MKLTTTHEGDSNDEGDVWRRNEVRCDEAEHVTCTVELFCSLEEHAAVCVTTRRLVVSPRAATHASGLDLHAHHVAL